MESTRKIRIAHEDGSFYTGSSWGTKEEAKVYESMEATPEVIIGSDGVELRKAECKIGYFMHTAYLRPDGDYVSAIAKDEPAKLAFRS